ncbi:MAG: threonylcarbamoyl-AMP synthase [Deltaproteobacteria bacterium]|nr:threonylcarbamoyl-AMP synthase [Deltaproteobacteria bacterium]
MKVLPVDPVHPEPARIAEAVDVMRRGGLVAFPTETVYGLGARALDAAHVRRIYAAKGRPGWNPLIVHVSGVEMARAHVVSAWPATAATLAAAFWPGPLTLVLPRAPAVPDEVNAGLPTVAVRVPAHPVARALIAALGEPVAAPSANRFMHVSPTRAEHVVRSLGDAVDLVLDGGRCDVGVESTVVDLSGAEPALLRPGGVPLDQLRAALPGVAFVHGPRVEDGAARASPGMAQRHYAPRVPVTLVAHGDTAAWQAARGEAGPGHGALVFSFDVGGALLGVKLPPDPGEAQALFYDALHRMEDAGCSMLVMEAPPEGAAWDALRDRMVRAAS